MTTAMAAFAMTLNRERCDRKSLEGCIERRTYMKAHKKKEH